MRWQWMTLALVAVGHAQNQLWVDLPPCAETCLIRQSTSEPCAEDDERCICNNKLVRDDVVHCTFNECSLKEGLGAVGHISSICMLPRRDRSQTLLSTMLSLYAIAFVFVVVRLVTRFTKTIKISGGYDDALIVAALVIASPGAFISPLWCQDIGKDAWTIPFDHLSRFGVFFVLFGAIYILSIGLIRTAILIFYLRIFPGQTLRRITWAVVGFNAVLTVVVFLLGLCQCQPLSYNWTQFSDEQGGRCFVNGATVATVHGGIGFILDAFILLLPMPTVYKLKVRNMQKVQIAIMFSLGLIATITSAVRFQYLFRLGPSRNATWDLWPTVIWTSVELYVSMICACLPAAKVAGDYVWKKLWEKSRPSIKHVLRKPQLAHRDRLKLWPESWSFTQKQRLDASAASDNIIMARTSLTMSSIQEDSEKGLKLPEWEIGVDGVTRSGRLCTTVIEGNSPRQESFP